MSTGGLKTKGMRKGYNFYFCQRVLYIINALVHDGVQQKGKNSIGRGRAIPKDNKNERGNRKGKS